MVDLELPDIGFGTGGAEYLSGRRCRECVALALNVGYRYIDTAQMYENEAAVGRGIADANVDRSDFALATKVRPENLGFDNVLTSTEASLERLSVEYLDLLYVHFPSGAYDPEETFAAFAELVDRELVTAVGVSNFSVPQLEEAVAVSEKPIVVNQVEMHPFCKQRELLVYARRNDVTLVGYCPLARGAVLDDPVITSIAAKHDVSPVAVTLMWLRQRAACPVPKSTDSDHIRENYEAMTKTLPPEDCERIEAIERTEKIVASRR